jgi:ribosomal protein L11 methyltransferase
MPSTAVTVPSKSQNHELLLGLLMTEEVQGVEEREGALVFFFEETGYPFVKAEFERIAAPFQSGPISCELILDQNWNEEWEKTIKPIKVGRFWIRPSWDIGIVPEDKIELIIDPKMSFGTGYHETTRLMMAGIEEMVREGDRVLDAGTGTGVLAFSALKIGASKAVGFDVDPICKGNADENSLMNGLSERFQMFVGTEKVVPSQTFDIVLANINRETLRAMLPALKVFMTDEAKLGLAGLLISDREIMLKELETNGLISVRETTEGDWWSVWAINSTSIGTILNSLL